MSLLTASRGGQQGYWSVAARLGVTGAPGPSCRRLSHRCRRPVLRCAWRPGRGSIGCVRGCAIALRRAVMARGGRAPFQKSTRDPSVRGILPAGHPCSVFVWSPRQFLPCKAPQASDQCLPASPLSSFALPSAQRHRPHHLTRTSFSCSQFQQSADSIAGSPPSASSFTPVPPPPPPPAPQRNQSHAKAKRLARGGQRGANAQGIGSRQQRNKHLGSHPAKLRCCRAGDAHAVMLALRCSPN